MKNKYNIYKNIVKTFSLIFKYNKKAQKNFSLFKFHIPSWYKNEFFTNIYNC